MESSLYLAHRYAYAVINTLALDEAQIEKIKKAVHFLQQHAGTFSLLTVSCVSDEAKMDLLEKFLMHFELDGTLKKLAGVLVKSKRITLLRPILHKLIEVYEAKHGIETFTIQSSCPLLPEQKDEVHQFLKHNTGHTIKSIFERNAALIAGIRMESSEHMWEYSIANQLKHMARQLPD